jgi:NTP pyrophosphatase (non-canonical NTP hydrolase)
MNPENNEVMDILQEECAEVIQAVSKIRRFGLTNSKPGAVYNNQQHLEEELGDVLAMIDILEDMKIIDHNNLLVAKDKKIDKLKLWSKIFNN